MLGDEMATEDRPGGWPYLIRQDRAVEVGGTLLHIAAGIQRLADATLMAATSELAEALFRLLTSSEITSDGLKPEARKADAVGWPVLVRAAQHVEIGANPALTNQP